MSSPITLVVRRTIQAPAERVFDAWTRPEHLVKWWGPRPVTCIEADVDLRVGGSYRIANLFPDGSVLWISGEFEVVEAPRRLVYTWRTEQKSETEAEWSRVSVRFETQANSAATEVIVLHERIDSEATRTGHERGWLGCLDNLARFFDAE
ncbi:MAG TPA: SRPBCC domain-containing protein [Polyangiaceae bacterium]|jgi:uncharacterized protein YndB with AHSA1/START domain|nr:SRPBCC domain-containing protein [Polyangiaceae bacterium]